MPLWPLRLEATETLSPLPRMSLFNWWLWWAKVLVTAMVACDWCSCWVLAVEVRPEADALLLFPWMWLSLSVLMEPFVVVLLEEERTVARVVAPPAGPVTAVTGRCWWELSGGVSYYNITKQNKRKRNKINLINKSFIISLFSVLLSFMSIFLWYTFDIRVLLKMHYSEKCRRWFE